ncbi:DUF7134 domain-containing protein, partial [Streptomyces sp. NPDC004980]
MRRFSLWLRGRPVVADSVLALFLMVLDVLGVGDEHHKASYLVFSLILPLPLILRRIYPRAVAAVLFVLSVATFALVIGIVAGFALGTLAAL